MYVCNETNVSSRTWLHCVWRIWLAKRALDRQPH